MINLVGAVLGGFVLAGNFPKKRFLAKGKDQIDEEFFIVLVSFAYFQNVTFSSLSLISILNR